MKNRRNAVDQIEFMRNLLAFSLVAAFVGALIRFSFSEVPAGSKEIVVYMVGQLSGMATMALGFYFVNKVGQDALDATRSENTGKLADAVTTALKTGTDPTGEGQAADQVVDAAAEKRDEIKGGA